MPTHRPTASRARRRARSPSPRRAAISARTPRHPTCSSNCCRGRSLHLGGERVGFLEVPDREHVGRKIQRGQMRVHLVALLQERGVDRTTELGRPHVVPAQARELRGGVGGARQPSPMAELFDRGAGELGLRIGSVELSLLREHRGEVEPKGGLREPEVAELLDQRREARAPLGERDRSADQRGGERRGRVDHRRAVPG